MRAPAVMLPERKKVRSIGQVVAGAVAVVALTGATPVPIATQFAGARAIDGAAVDVAGKVTLVNFWATWCVPCRAEMPMIDAYFRQHRAAGLAVVAVAMDAGAPVGRLRAATGARMFAVVPVSRVRMARRDIPNGLPVTRIYDRHGTLRFDSARDGRGTIDAATLDRVVVPLLREAL